MSCRPGDRLLDDLVDTFPAGQLAEDDVGDATQRLDLAADLLCCGRVTPVDDDVGAGFRQAAGERASKASRRAGDQGRTAGE